MLMDNAPRWRCRHSALEALVITVQRFGQFLLPDVETIRGANGVALSRHLVEFSCHREITDQELTLRIARIGSALGRTAGGPAGR